MHLGLPFKGISEALTVFDKEWLEPGNPLILEPQRILIPPAGDSFFATDWKHKYVFEFILTAPETVYKRRRERHKEGYFPVDDDLSLDMVTKQTEVYCEVALYLHRAGMQVYVREDLNSPPMKIVEKGDVVTPMWLLPKTEQTGRVTKRGDWKNLFIKRKVINWLSVTNELTPITKPCRIAHDGKTFELHLGEQQLHFHPEIPLGVKKKHIKKNWLIFSPVACSVKNIVGFARLCVGDSVIIGRENTLYTKLFDLSSSVSGRHVQVTNRNGDLVLTPLAPKKNLAIVRVEDQDIRERVEAHRFEAFIAVQSIYGGTIEQLPPEPALKLLRKTNKIVAQDSYSITGNRDSAGGIIEIPDALTPIVIGDLHGQVDNLLKIITENYLLECLYANTACLVILGDAVHSEIAGEMEDMESSIVMMDFIFKLKCHFPNNIFYLRGNHDSFDPELSKNGISQGLLMQQQLLDSRGQEYVSEMRRFYTILPYIAKNSYFYCCHAGPPMKKTRLEDLINIHERPDLIKEITSSRVKRPHSMHGYIKKDVRRFRKTLGMPKGTPFIVGHTPMDPFGSFWTNVGNIKNHHIIYSGHQEGSEALLMDGRHPIPLRFPAEPVVKVIEKIS